MRHILQELEPKKVLHFFEEISSIPRGSYNEDKAIEFIVNFAKERKLWVFCDKYRNVYIKKNATKGKEDCKPILFQGHIDMVCEKDSTSSHDFLKDGLTLQVNGDILSAKGTTLGADNGVAIAIMLALLDDNSIAHPPIECLMTVEEEVGLTGAQHIESDKIDSRTMINLDTSKYGCVLVSCSGGRETIISKKFFWESGKRTGLKIKISGLRGGHSGININEGRANANRLMVELLMDLVLSQQVQLSSFLGGEKSNAIPREATCTLWVEDTEKSKEIIQQFYHKARNEYSDADLSIVVNEVTTEHSISYNETTEVVKILMNIPNGIVKMSEEFPELVKTSINLGVVHLTKETSEFIFSLRSSSNNEMLELVDLLTSISKKYHTSISHSGIYPPWEYEEKSPIREVFLHNYKTLTGKDMQVEAVHCGLECGIIKNKIPDMDIIACGPTIYDYHCPSERMEISSLAKLWELIKVVLNNL